MEYSLIPVLIFTVLLAGLALLVYRIRRKAQPDPRRASSLLSTIQITDEDLDADAEMREIRSRRHKFYRISGFKWILCVLFSMLLTFLATFEFWVDYYPAPQVGVEYPVPVVASHPVRLGSVSYAAGHVLVARGTRISDQDARLIDAYRSQRHLPPPAKLMGFFAFFLLFTLFFVYWLGIFLESNPYTETQNLLFLLSVITIVLMIAKTGQLTAFFSMYYVPMGMLAMLVIILVSHRVVPSVLIFATLFAAMVAHFDIQTLFVVFAGAMLTVFWLQRVKKRSQVISAGFAVGVSNLVVYLSVSIISDSNPLASTSQHHAVAAFANGLLCGFLTLLLIPFFEKAFGYLSPFRLMELSDLDSDLLRELYLKAPGTYHHSLAVANLAEIAANEIGADAMLLRVGAYYHDIGKMFKPKFFVENMVPDCDNPHNLVSPYASSKILKSHVALGLELGEKYGLPRKILELIPQHHGTSVMEFFYEKARKTAENTTISEKYFSYPGPRPRTKEAAILMIVDSVEAAFRVLADHTEDTVRKMIEKIVRYKIEQGQLDESPLTLSELRRITYVLAKALSTSSHRRIDYPTGTGIGSDFGTHPLAPGQRDPDAPAPITGEMDATGPHIRPTPQS